MKIKKYIETNKLDEALAEKIESGKLVVITIKGEVRSGKSTVGFKIMKEINELIFKLKFRKENMDINKQGEYEIKKYHVLDIELDNNTLFEFCDENLLLKEDPEKAFFSYGVTIDLNEDYMYIDIDKFVTGCKSWIDDIDNKDLIIYENICMIVKQLSEYKEYTAYL